jgi:hypothetical protein
MVWNSGSQVFILVAIITAYPERFKTQQGFRRVAGIAIGCYVRAYKRKTAKLVKRSNIRNNPGFWSMAP